MKCGTVAVGISSLMSTVCLDRRRYSLGDLTFVVEKKMGDCSSWY